MRAGEKARAEACISLAGHDRLEQHGPVLRIVLEVGVLHDDDVAGAGGERGPDRLALAAVLGLEHETVDVARLRERDEAPSPAGGRAVVDADDLLAYGRAVHAV